MLLSPLALPGEDARRERNSRSCASIFREPAIAQASALDRGLFEAWIQSIDDAAAELRAATGVEDVAVVGIRLGAMLALTAAARGSNLQDLVLWGPPASGRAMLRELRAFGNMERLEYANGDAAASAPSPGLEIGGFLIAPETQHALENLVLSPLPAMPGRRVLLLSRDDLPADAKLTRALQSSGCAVETGNGSGYAGHDGAAARSDSTLRGGASIVEFVTARNVPRRRAQRIGHRAIARRLSLAKRQAQKVGPECSRRSIREGHRPVHFLEFFQSPGQHAAHRMVHLVLECRRGSPHRTQSDVGGGGAALGEARSCFPTPGPSGDRRKRWRPKHSGPKACTRIIWWNRLKSRWTLYVPD